MLNDLDPQNALGKYTLSITMHNTGIPRAAEREAEREAETQVISRKEVQPENQFHDRTLVTMTPSWPDAVKGKQT